MHNQQAKKVKKMTVIPGGGQMSLIRDTEEVLKFLEFAGRKNMLNEHAVNNRLTACHNLFSVLNEEEDNLDYILKNLDVLVNRFRNKNQNVRASTLKVYKSRAKSSIEDFKAWSADPFAWERKITDKAKSAGLERRKEKNTRAKQARKAPSARKREEEVAPEPTASAQPGSAPQSNVRKVSFPIRDGFCVEMSLPVDGISFKELQRLGMFLYPYCSDLAPDQVRWPSLF